MTYKVKLMPGVLFIIFGVSMLIGLPDEGLIRIQGVGGFLGGLTPIAIGIGLMLLAKSTIKNGLEFFDIAMLVVGLTMAAVGTGLIDCGNGLVTC